MSPTAQQLLASALALPEADFAELAEAISVANGPPVPELVGEAWEAELDRRQAEMEAGTVTLIPWQEVVRRARERVEGRADG